MLRLNNKFTGAIFFLLIACTEDNPLDEYPPLNWHGERISIGTDMDIEICDGTLVFLDSYIDYVESRLGLSYPKTAIMYLLEDEQSVVNACEGSERGGCYHPDLGVSFVSSARWSITETISAPLHEFIHDYQYSTKMESAPFFLTEGLAVLLSEDLCAAPNVSSLPVDFLLDLPVGSSFLCDEYYLGALFIQFLIEKYGASEVVSFFSLVDEFDLYDNQSIVFEESFGNDLDSVITEFDDNQPEFLPNPWICQGAETQWVGGKWSASTGFDCKSDKVINYFEKTEEAVEEKRLYSTLINIEQTDTYLLTGDDKAEVSIVPCFCDGTTVSSSTSEPKEVDLTEGSYQVYMIASVLDVDEGASFDVTISKVQ